MISKCKLKEKKEIKKEKGKNQKHKRTKTIFVAVHFVEPCDSEQQVKIEFEPFATISSLCSLKDRPDLSLKIPIPVRDFGRFWVVLAAFPSHAIVIFFLPSQIF